jgi:hypothetical protein
MGSLSDQGLIEAFVTKANNEVLDDEGASIPRHWSHFPNGQRPILIGFHSSATVLNKRTPHDRHSARQPWASQGSEQSRRFGFFFRLPIRFHIRKPIFYFGHFDQNGKILFTDIVDSLKLVFRILNSDFWCFLVFYFNISGFLNFYLKFLFGSLGVVKAARLQCSIFFGSYCDMSISQAHERRPFEQLARVTFDQALERAALHRQAPVRGKGPYA